MLMKIDEEELVILTERDSFDFYVNRTNERRSWVEHVVIRILSAFHCEKII
jgi:hypothetical protein